MDLLLLFSIISSCLGTDMKKIAIPFYAVQSFSHFYVTKLPLIISILCLYRVNANFYLYGLDKREPDLSIMYCSFPKAAIVLMFEIASPVICKRKQ